MRQKDIYLVHLCICLQSQAPQLHNRLLKLHFQLVIPNVKQVTQFLGRDEVIDRALAVMGVRVGVRVQVPLNCCFFDGGDVETLWLTR